MAVRGYDPIVGKLLEIVGAPKDTKWLEIRFAANEIVTARCEYYPNIEESAETITEQFKLVRVDDDEEHFQGWQNDG